MVTIKTEHGEYTGDTMRDAQRAAQKGQKEHDRKEAARKVLRDDAHNKAVSVAYCIYRGLMLGEAKRGIRIMRPGHTDWPVRRSYSFDTYSEAAQLTSCHGSAELRVFGWEIVAILTNGVGSDCGYFLKCKLTGEIEGHACGIVEGELAAVSMPGVRMEAFNERRDLVKERAAAMTEEDARQMAKEVVG